MVVERLHTLGTVHEEIQIDRWATRSHAVQLRIYVVGATLESLGGQTTTCISTEEAHGERAFATLREGRSDEKGGKS